MWNYGDILDALVGVLPDDGPALIHGERVINWGEFHERTNRLARALQAQGLQPGAKVSFYMRNQPALFDSYT